MKMYYMILRNLFPNSFQPRTPEMKSGYEAELNNHQKKLTESKAFLEEFYAARHEDKDIAGELKDRYDDMITKADATMLSFTTGVKLVKAAIVPRLFFARDL